MVEQRESIRVAAPEGSVVVNQLNQVKVGRIVDISVSGFLLAGREKFKAGMIFQLQLFIGEHDPINVGAECIWSDLQTSGLTFGGFHIIDISDDGQATLKQLIEQLEAD